MISICTILWQLLVYIDDDNTKFFKKLKKIWPVLIFESSYLPATYNHEVLALDISTDCPLLSSLPLPCQVTSAVSVPFLPNTTPKMRKKYSNKVKKFEQNGAKSLWSLILILNNTHQGRNHESF